MPRFAHLIFDLDGTLVDTKADLAAAANFVRETFGLPPLSVSQVSSYVGQGVRILVERVLGPSHAHLSSRGFELFMTYYQNHLLDHSRVYPGIDRLLSIVRAQEIVLSVLTNKPEASSRAILSGLGLCPFFAALVGGDTLPTKKPNPQGVTYLQRHTGVSLAQTLLIGDSAIDVETGQAVGVSTCGVLWGFGAKGLLTLSPQFLVETPEELLELVLV